MGRFPEGTTSCLMALSPFKNHSIFQLNSSIGETGYAVALTNFGVLELTLNSAELTDEYQGEETNQ